MGWVVNATPWPLFPSDRPCTICTGGWVGPRADLDGCGPAQYIYYYYHHHHHHHHCPVYAGYLQLLETNHVSRVYRVYIVVAIL
jgi:hypothetical protein